jgi:copper(I)-binding protein
MRNLLFVGMTLFLSMSTSAFSHETTDMSVENAYVRATIPGTDISSAYMDIVSHSAKKVRLVSASSSVSKRIEIHEHSMSEGMMRMRQKEFVEIAPRQRVTFKPSGLHLMIFDLKQPLKAQEDIMITLLFDDKSQVSVKFPVASIKQKKHHH